MSEHITTTDYFWPVIRVLVVTLALLSLATAAIVLFPNTVNRDDSRCTTRN